MSPLASVIDNEKKPAYSFNKLFNKHVKQSAKNKNVHRAKR